MAHTIWGGFGFRFYGLNVHKVNRNPSSWLACCSSSGPDLSVWESYSREACFKTLDILRRPPSQQSCPNCCRKGSAQCDPAPRVKCDSASCLFHLFHIHLTVWKRVRGRARGRGVEKVKTTGKKYALVRILQINLTLNAAILIFMSYKRSDGTLLNSM